MPQPKKKRCIQCSNGLPTMALAFESHPNDGASVLRVPSTSGDTYIPESAHDKSICGLNEKSFVLASARRQPCDAYPFGVSPPLENCDCEECPRGSTATTPSIASVGGLQINSQRLFAPKLAEGHHGGTGIHRCHGPKHGVLPRKISRRRKCIVQEQVGF